MILMQKFKNFRNASIVKGKYNLPQPCPKKLENFFYIKCVRKGFGLGMPIFPRSNLFRPAQVFQALQRWWSKGETKFLPHTPGGVGMVLGILAPPYPSSHNDGRKWKLFLKN